MSPAHLHLLLNHAPLFGLLGALLLLLGGLIWKSRDVLRAGLLVAMAAAVITVPAYLTGEPAEEVVERIPGAQEAALEEHEDAAMSVLVAAIAAGLAGAAGFMVGRSDDQRLRTGAMATAVIAAVGIGLAGYVNNLGGQIRHTEISGGQQSAQPDGKGSAEERE